MSETSPSTHDVSIEHPIGTIYKRDVTVYCDPLTNFVNVLKCTINILDIRFFLLLFIILLELLCSKLAFVKI